MAKEKKKVKKGEKSSKDKAIYTDKEKQSEYDKLRKEGKTDHQARKIVSLKHK